MDKSVIIDAAKGDIKAFRLIFNAYITKMKPVSLRYSYTNFEAEDILQEAFVKIYKNLKYFKFEGSFESWIRKIVINTALNHRKKNINFYELQNLEEVHESEMEGEELEVLTDAEPSKIMQIINELPEGYKVVFNLYVFEELPHKEIASILGISEGTSRSQYSKAKRYIKNIISSQGTNENSLLASKSF